jgi:GH24 family phage-related lysozyme (muramidase)
MKINNEGLQIIKDSEGLRLKAYRCSSNILTVGWGHTGPDVYESTVITTERADLLLRQDVAKFEEMVRTMLSNIKLNENQFSALVSLCFNCGSDPIRDGNTIRRCLDNKQYDKAADGFLLWVKGGGVTLPGLVTRRQRERELFLKPVKEHEENNKLYVFKTTENTWLKSKPVQSSELDDKCRAPLNVMSYSVGFLLGVENNHLKVDLIQVEVPEFSILPDTQYLFKDHIEVYELSKVDL